MGVLGLTLPSFVGGIGGFLVGLIPFIAVLLVLVLAHELGHFVTAKLAHVTVQEFGIGYPPRLFSIRFKGTDYSVNLLPLGGFVKLLGEEDPTMPGSLASKNAGTRLGILFAGSFMNALLPIVLLTGSLVVPRETVAGEVHIIAVAPDSPADRAGMKPGDVIVRINEREIQSTRDVGYDVQLNQGSDLQMEVRRGTERLFLHMVPRWSPPEGQGPTGITLAMPIAVSEVQPGSPAAAAGFQVGDYIQRINGRNVLYAKDVGFPTQGLARDTEVVILRQGDTKTVRFSPPSEDPAASGLSVAGPRKTVQVLPPLQALGTGIRSSFDMLTLFKNSIFGMITGRSGPAVTGPIGIAQATGEVAEAGISPLLEWTAFLSMNLAIMNVLPIPMLDGGRMFFVILEWLRRGRKVPPERESLVHLVGFLILMGFILIVSYYDIVRIINKESFLR